MNRITERILERYAEQKLKVDMLAEMYRVAKAAGLATEESKHALEQARGELNVLGRGVAESLLSSMEAEKYAHG